MKDYQDFPPLKYFIRVLKNCPKSAFIYIELYKKSARSRSFPILKKDIKKDYLISSTVFRNLLTPLVFLNLISLRESDVYYQIDILGNNLDD